jgi:hypothetical protein
MKNKGERRKGNQKGVKMKEEQELDETGKEEKVSPDALVPKR